LIHFSASAMPARLWPGSQTIANAAAVAINRILIAFLPSWLQLQKFDFGASRDHPRFDSVPHR
jgi:hypothetical protein